ncbi:MAG TPA: NADH-quinone oxidoreductase subunit C [Dehalococcoidia bacterium]|nr:NADH-quinone oxidoreductase subunit C [Dehalococcoidia bacterium]
MTTVAIPGTEVAERITVAHPGAVLESNKHSVTVAADRVAEVARFLRDDAEFDCKFLNTMLGVDWLEHFDVVYVLSSMAKNHELVLEARCNHDDPVVQSVSRVWQGAVLQEREIYDLMGISFSGHPDLKRIFLWEGFPGHPLRKDFLALPGGYKPGLQRFPFEFPPGERSYQTLAPGQAPTAPGVPRLVQPMPGQAAAQSTSGGQLAVRGGGATHTRAPGDLEPAPPANPGGAGNPTAEIGETGGRTPLANEENESAGGGSGYAGEPETKQITESGDRGSDA